MTSARLLPAGPLCLIPTVSFAEVTRVTVAARQAR